VTVLFFRRSTTPELAPALFLDGLRPPEIVRGLIFVRFCRAKEDGRLIFLSAGGPEKVRALFWRWSTTQKKENHFFPRRFATSEEVRTLLRATFLGSRPSALGPRPSALGHGTTGRLNLHVIGPAEAGVLPFVAALAPPDGRSPRADGATATRAVGVAATHLRAHGCAATALPLVRESSGPRYFQRTVPGVLACRRAFEGARPTLSPAGRVPSSLACG
jgi:hypothetical protein